MTLSEDQLNKSVKKDVGSVVLKLAIVACCRLY